MFTARFRFEDSLNDFLLPSKRNKIISYNFNHAPAIKDPIEALGIPHVEVKEIIVNGTAVGFYYPLQAGDWVEVVAFRQVEDAPKRFLLDVHLGKLARLLRLLGFDTLYENDLTDQNIIEIAKNEDRVVLTRDVGLLKNKSIRWGYWLRSQDAFLQLEEIMSRFALKEKVQPFSRCLACNGSILPVEKREVVPFLPLHTKVHLNEFYQCQACRRIYWKGSHYERMLKTVAKFCS